jgi:hypothetical protein
VERAPHPDLLPARGEKEKGPPPVNLAEGSRITSGLLTSLSLSGRSRGPGQAGFRARSEARESGCKTVVFCIDGGGPAGDKPAD